MGASVLGCQLCPKRLLRLSRTRPTPGHWSPRSRHPRHLRPRGLRLHRHRRSGRLRLPAWAGLPPQARAGVESCPTGHPAMARETRPKRPGPKPHPLSPSQDQMTRGVRPPGATLRFRRTGQLRRRGRQEMGRLRRRRRRLSRVNRNPHPFGRVLRRPSRRLSPKPMPRATLTGTRRLRILRSPSHRVQLRSEPHLSSSKRQGVPSSQALLHLRGLSPQVLRSSKRVGDTLVAHG